MIIRAVTALVTPDTFLPATATCAPCRNFVLAGLDVRYARGGIRPHCPGPDQRVDFGVVAVISEKVAFSKERRQVVAGSEQSGNQPSWYSGYASFVRSFG